MSGVLEEQISRLSGGQGPVAGSTEESIAALRKFFVLESSYIDAARDEIERVAGSFKRYVSDWLGLTSIEVSAVRNNLLID